MNGSPEHDTLPAAARRFLVVGCGSIGKRHIRNLLQLGARDVAAFDPRPDRRQEVEEQTGVRTVADLEAGLQGGAEVALICSPTRLHLEHALLAARAGCHLFVEKPVSDSLDGLDTLLAEVAQRKLVTLVGCNFRFHPALLQVKRLLDNGAAGRVVSARAQFGQYLPDWHPWEDYRQGYSAQRRLGGGVLLDRIHELDYMRWLLGEVRDVYALMGHLSHLEIDTEDAVEMLVRFEGGAFGSIHLDYVRRTYDCSLEIVGDLGTIEWSFQEHRVRWYQAKKQQWHSVEWSRWDPNQMYVDEMRHFLRALSGLEPSQNDAAEAARVLAVALAARQSSEEGRVISL